MNARRLEMSWAAALALATAALVCWLALGNLAWSASQVRSGEVRVVGTVNCPEDERLVPVRQRGYSGDRRGGWVYRCSNFENRGPFYKK